MSKTTGWTIVIFFVAAIIGGFFLLKGSTSGASPSFSFATTSDAMGTIVDTMVPIASREVPAGFKEYRNEQFGFSLLYPETIQPQEFLDRGPELTVLFQGGDGEPGFQVYVAPIVGNQISEERFLRDAPSGVRKDPKDVSVAGVQAVAFEGFHATVGQTYEVWFIGSKQGREIPSFLYEVSTYKELREDLDSILSTWSFL